jgi:hypothetical protein
MASVNGKRLEIIENEDIQMGRKGNREREGSFKFV